MWSTDTYWFDAAVVTAIFAVGSPLFGHFEEHKPKWKRLLKVVAVVGLVVGLSALGARWLAYSIIGLMLFGAAVVHVYWLPKHGVNGWTGEPKDRYYELLGFPKRSGRIDARKSRVQLAVSPDAASSIWMVTSGARARRRRT